MPSEPTSPAEQFSLELRERVRFWDVLTMAAIPVILVGIHLIPLSIRQEYLFEYTDPNPVTALVSALVHLHWAHLGVNIVLYALIIGMVYVLDTLTDRRTRFYRVFGVFVTVFPVVLSYLNLAAVRPAAGFGFSGIVMAFAGYLPVALAEFLEVRLEISYRRLLAPAIMFPSLGLIAVLSLWSVIPENTTVLLGVVGLVAAILLTTGLYLIAIYDAGSISLSTVSVAVNLPGYGDIAVGSLLVILSLPFVAFPLNPQLASGTLNLYIHLLGYALGFLVTYSHTEFTASFPQLTASG